MKSEVGAMFSVIDNIDNSGYHSVTGASHQVAQQKPSATGGLRGQPITAMMEVSTSHSATGLKNHAFLKFRLI